MPLDGWNSPEGQRVNHLNICTIHNNCFIHHYPTDSLYRTRIYNEYVDDDENTIDDSKLNRRQIYHANRNNFQSIIASNIRSNAVYSSQHLDVTAPINCSADNSNNNRTPVHRTSQNYNANTLNNDIANSRTVYKHVNITNADDCLTYTSNRYNIYNANPHNNQHTNNSIAYNDVHYFNDKTFNHATCDINGQNNYSIANYKGYNGANPTDNINAFFGNNVHAATNYPTNNHYTGNH
ncbi:Hypp199 [Branchiostoma lanceolatum]|uniref:Hypp199 protein n=1 Tax=Branchiostoma lanceolatum TaxID=7740 RepID=A0A8J9VYB1_BRALA|nr:Hypp199 [Branchiostoma lanceolatum]